MTFRKLKNIAVLVFVLASATLGIINVHNAHAVSYRAPDGPDSNFEDGTGQSPVYLIVSKGDGSSLNAPVSTVVIYSLTPNPKIVIGNYNHCYNKNGTPLDSSNPGVKSGSDTSFTLYDGGDPDDVGVITTAFNTILPDSPACTGASLTLQPANIITRGSTSAGLGKYYVTRLKTTLTQPTGNGTNAFTVSVLDQANHANGYVSYTNQDNSTFAIGKRPPSGSQNTAFQLKFAIPCDADMTKQLQPLKWFDADKGLGNQEGNIFFEVGVRDRGSNDPYVLVKNQYGFDAQGRYLQVGGNDAKGSLKFPFEKDKEYNWIWRNVSSGNGIQFGMPYNSIYSTVVCSSYNLIPTLSVNGSTVEPGATVTTTAKIQNNGRTDSEDAGWQINRFVVASGLAVPNSGGGTSQSGTTANPNTKTPCNDYFLPSVSCTRLATGSGIYKVETATLDPLSDDIGDLPVGSKICYALSVKPYKNGSTDWRHSAPDCVKIGKKPKVQIWGSDVVTRGLVATSTSTKKVGSSEKTFGSWGEYGIFSVGRNSGAASGAGLVNGSPTEPQDSWSALTFANRGGIFGSFGGATTLPAKPAIATYFLSKPSTIISGDLSLTDRSGILRYNGVNPINIGASTIKKNKSIVILAPNATVTIINDISYVPGPFNQISELPQAIIIASSINIKGNVTNVDAWLIATNNINTCSDVATNIKLGSNICTNTLKINGPVVSNKLYLRRTAGSNTGAASDDPAETINLRADAYLWAQAQVNGNSNATTVFSYEVPPRF
ncbi:MAG: hypothetical protein ABIQ04_05055 [Candidatus Saccharimonadales bacterium]